MKKLALMLLALAFVSGTAFAAGGATGSGASLDLTGNYATEPTGGFDSTFGFELGANIDASRLGIDLGASKNVELQGRVSLGYYKFDDDIIGADLEYRRIPFDIAARVLAPVSPQLKVYGQLGLEISFDKVELAHPVFGKVSESDTNLGLVPAVGIIFPLSNQFYLGGNLAWHLISDDYFTLGVTIGFNLP